MLQQQAANRRDSVEQVTADLDELPPMRPDYVKKYLDDAVDSPGETLAIVREMRRAGWTEDQARTMMTRWPAKGIQWLADQTDRDAEFDRCWELASKRIAEIQKPKRIAKVNDFISHASDQWKVLAFIEANPGLCTRELLRAGCGLSTPKRDGRIQAALKVLLADERIYRKPGPRGALFHYVLEGRGTDCDQTLASKRSSSVSGGKRYATVRDGARLKGKIWKQYQGIMIKRWRAFLLLRRIADQGPSLFSTLRDAHIVRPTVLWKYLRALEDAGLIALAKAEIADEVVWVATAAPPEALNAVLASAAIPAEDKYFYDRLHAFYEYQKASATVRASVDLDHFLGIAR